MWEDENLQANQKRPKILVSGTRNQAPNCGSKSLKRSKKLRFQIEVSILKRNILEIHEMKETNWNRKPSAGLVNCNLYLLLVSASAAPGAVAEQITG